MPQATPMLSEPRADGRRQRRMNNRDKIVGALKELVREGVVSPSAEAVAARAGVSARTVFRCFEDMEALFRALTRMLQEEFLPYARLDVTGLPRRKRLDALIANRAEAFEQITPFRIAADAHRHESQALCEDHAFFVDVESGRLQTLVNADDALKGPAIEALNAVTCFDFWRRLRLDQGLSEEAAQAAMRFAAHAILDAAGANDA